MVNIMHGDHGAETVFESFFHSTAASLIEVMILVMFGLFLIEILNFFTKDKLKKGIENSTKSQPFIGALLGLVPGCGGTIFLVPFYNKGTVSFGALAASFISTIGEAAFILLAMNPMVYLWISLISFVAGLVTGYVIDLTPLKNKFSKLSEKPAKKDMKMVVNNQHVKQEAEWFLTLDNKIMPIFVGLVFIFIAPFTVMTLSFPSDYWNETINSWSELTEWVAFISMLVMVGYFLLRSFYKKHLFKWDDRVHEHHGHVTFKHSMKDAFLNVLYIGLWVWYGITAIDMLIFGFGESNLFWFFTLGGGALTMFLTAGAGIIPGCGPQIAVLSIYQAGMLPGSALIANSIIQDGDAGFPLMSNNPKAFMWIKVVNLIPGLAVGSTFLMLENLTELTLPF